MVYGQYAWGYPTHAYIRTTANADIDEVKKYITQTIAEFAPNANPESYEVKFYDTELEINYQVEDKLSTLVAVFSVLSIIISIIGVFGLVLFETQYRRREIGIRRVHGASAKGIIRMFNKQYLIIVAICSAVAIPVSYFVIDHWMQQFAYRSPMAWWVFAIAVAIVMLVTFLTVTIRSWNAANENPTDSIAH
jgi:putative ABC transport system permease protein